MIQCIIVGIVIVITGIFIFLRPDLFWELTEKWKSYRADSPSDFYLKNTKFGGIALILWGIVMIVLPFISES